MHAAETTLVETVLAAPDASLVAGGRGDPIVGASALLWRQAAPALDASFSRSDADVLEITLAGSQRWDIWLDGCNMGQRRYEAGHAALWPAGTELSLRGAADADVLHLVLDPSLLRATGDVLDGRGWSVDPIKPGRSATLIELGLLLLREPHLSATRGKCFAETLRVKLAQTILEELGNRPLGKASKQPSLSPRHVRIVLDYMHANLGDDPSLTELSRLAGMSKHHFLRCFRDAVGVPPHRYLLHLRMTEAQRRLSRGSRALAALAGELGFSNQSHFTAAFSRRYGISPGAYRALFRSAPAPLPSARAMGSSG